MGEARLRIDSETGLETGDWRREVSVHSQVSVHSRGTNFNRGRGLVLLTGTRQSGQTGGIIPLLWVTAHTLAVRPWDNFYLVSEQKTGDQTSWGWSL